MGDKSVSRRDFLKKASFVGGAAILAACQPQIVEKTVEVPVEKTVKETVVVEKSVEKTVKETVVVAAQPDMVVLTIAHAWEAAFEAHQETFDNEFMKKNPKIFIKRINSEWSAHNQIVPTWAAANELPDIIYVHGSRAFPWNKEGIMIPIDNYVTVDTAFDVKGVWDEALRLYQYKAKQYEIPYDHGPVILAYNKDLFDAAKVDYPNENWTWDDFLTTSKKMTLPDKNQWGYSGYYGGTFSLGNEIGIALVGPWGGNIFADDESKLVIDEDKAVTALKWWADLIHKEKVAPTPDVTSAFPSGIWISGSAAMFGLATWGVPQMHEFGTFKYDVAPWPKGPEGRKTGSFGSGYGITKDSKNPDAAWTYLSNYLNVDGMTYMWASSGRGSPARKAAYPAYLKAEINPPNAKYFGEALDTYAVTGHPYHTVASGEVSDILGKYAGLVATGDMTVEDCVKNIVAEANPKLAAAEH